LNSKPFLIEWLFSILYSKVPKCCPELYK
jgi:hypothetical protein